MQPSRGGKIQPRTIEEDVEGAQFNHIIFANIPTSSITRRSKAKATDDHTDDADEE